MDDCFQNPQNSAAVRVGVCSQEADINQLPMPGLTGYAVLTMTRCCMDGSGTGIRRALPIAGWGTSPSPPISLEVSTMTTRLCSSSASVRAISRMTVVLPTPGLPRNRMLLATASTSTYNHLESLDASIPRQVFPGTEGCCHRKRISSEDLMYLKILGISTADDIIAGYQTAAAWRTWKAAFWIYLVVTMKGYSGIGFGNLCFNKLS